MSKSNLADYIIARRRYYHAHPELSFQEYATTEQLRRDLEEMGIPAQTFPDYPGLVATIEGAMPGRTLMLRADIDALPVQEETGLPFASQNPGVMHACGHDAHIAMLLGAARELYSRREQFSGGVRLLFQAAEETSKGARYYIERGLLDGVDAIFALHVWGALSAPLLCVAPGARLAGHDKLCVKIRGAAAHGAEPQYGRDAIVAASAVVMGLQTLVSRWNDPREPLVLTVGTFHGGEAFNLICKEASLELTIRSFSAELRGRLERELRTLITHTAEAFGCTAELEWSPLLPPVINRDETLNRLAYDAAVELFGTEGLGELPPLMISEDFALYGERVPAFFGFVGSRDVAKGQSYPNHHEKYSADESALLRGAEFTVQFAMKFLNQLP